jgi:hypothetical protein
MWKIENNRYIWKAENQSLEIARKRRAKLMEYELTRNPYIGLKRNKKENIDNQSTINSNINSIISNFELVNNDLAENYYETNDLVESSNNYIEEIDIIGINNSPITNVNKGIKISFCDNLNDNQCRISYLRDDFVSANQDYKNFNIRNEVKYLLDRVNNFCKPHDYNEIICDYHISNLTIGECMILHRENMIRHSLSEKAGDDIFEFAKITLPIKCNLHKKKSSDSLSYMSPPLMLTYDICSKKGCKVFVGNNEKLNFCNGTKCMTRRWKSCTKKNVFKIELMTAVYILDLH